MSRASVLAIGLKFVQDSQWKQRFDQANLVPTLTNDLQRAFKIATEDKIDLILIELELPNQNVIAWIERLRKSKSTLDLPLILLHKQGKEEEVAKAILAGASDFLIQDSPFFLIQIKIQRILEDRETVNQLRASEERYALAARGTNDGIWDWDLITDSLYFTNHWSLMLGLEDNKGLSDSAEWFERVHSDDISTLRSRLALHVEAVTSHFECQFRMRHQDDYYIWVLCRGIATRDENGKAIRMAGTVTDLTDRSLHDTRTGLPFRNFFMDRLRQAMVRTQLSPQSSYSVLFVDIDRFKVISEGFGHNIVDELLVAFARRLEKCLAMGDTLAFLGGDSFVILLADGRDLKLAHEVANQIHLQLIAPFIIKDSEVFTKASIGMAFVDPEIRNPEEILRQAHTAMKFARQLGSGHTEAFDKGMASKGRELLEMESKLRSALDKNEFVLYYQPQISLATNQIVGVETLLRWKRDGKDWVSPGKFIPIAEETDLIVNIGEWVLRSACQQNVLWQKMGYPPLRLAVNLSERQFRSRNLARMVEHILAETGMQPQLLELELTESIFMEDIESCMRTLNSLREMGIKIALDDFGTGYSSLSYLKKFPINTLKIDRAFVTDLTHDYGDAAICSTIIHLAHQFKMDVIAEGVETKEQLIILRAFQCDEIQGYLFSPPLSQFKLEELMQQQQNQPRELMLNR